MSPTPAPIPTPAEVLAAGDHHQRYARQVDDVITTCRDRLNRGVPASAVTDYLRKQYLHLASLAAAVEVLDDVATDRRDDKRPRWVGEKGPELAPMRVRDGDVRYSPFGNAQPRVSRKAARA